VKEINILEAPIFSNYFYEFINSCSEYTITKKFMKENISIVGMCRCRESWCSTVSLKTKKPLEKSQQEAKNDTFDNKIIMLHIDNEFIEFEAVGSIFPYKQEILKLIPTRMYIDDTRIPLGEYDFVVRNYNEAIEIIKQYGVPNFISFNHNLDVDKKETFLKSGYDLAKWLIKSDVNNTVKIPKDFNFKIHSQNSLDKQNIIYLLNEYLLSSGIKE